MKHDAQIALDAQNIVGESLIWDHRRNTFFWVDIIGKHIHAFDPENGAHDHWQTPDFVTSIGLASENGFVVGLCRDVVLWRPGGVFEPLAVPEPDLPENRLNEGVVGPDGAFWVGTMQNNIFPNGEPKDITESTGALYRITTDGTVNRLSEPTFGITNTLIWSGDRLITADTMENALYSFAVDPATGRLSDRKTILEGFARGLPDGSAQDSDGMIWNCRVVGGSCLLHLSPAGAQLGLAELPVSWPTSCAFGGTNLDQLFVTSARFTMNAAHLRDNPNEGALVSVQTGGRGTRSHVFGG
ncbi:SMP-30/gluconolactonase/LRE family protein [Thiosulfatihalobacter marinus]|jgi:sugar lactone lactonase YvrE|uniref:SMP-30/gluconolactonase/LRE family protein n=1 Tax=Thiosulfatihalobacter marinus TaxID=2792481 RepID=UPI0018D993DB|nr:SMP-30/gluconolactonase/LRE family protein [Thiosulfatihalobacter marinus]